MAGAYREPSARITNISDLFQLLIAHMPGVHNQSAAPKTRMVFFRDRNTQVAMRTSRFTACLTFFRHKLSFDLVL